ncbi:hypothetical protein M0R72_16645 [Candidatus Pacearchaeota archaeon]|jgi:hypothetical protein|nr:hypothetical protein [Candidatus Pacearchaeota archaeon]
MTKKVVCQECGGPVEGIYVLRRGIWRQPIDAITGEGRDMCLDDVEWDDMDFNETSCVDHPTHDCGVRLNYEWDGDEDMYEVQRPTVYSIVLTDRGIGALTALAGGNYNCSMRTLLSMMPLEAPGPSLDEATEAIPESDAMRNAYNTAVSEKFVRIVTEEVD